MTEIRAIETRYKGYRFRSRLEARWAVCFDALGIPWEYEVEGFVTSEGPYLPDFRLWGHHWVEVKPTIDSVKERIQLLAAFAMEAGNLSLCIGTPTEQWYPSYFREGEPNEAYMAGLHFDWIDWGHSAYKHRPWYACCGGKGLDSTPPPLYYLTEAWLDRRGPVFPRAVVAARSARFERAGL